MTGAEGKGTIKLVVWLQKVADWTLQREKMVVAVKDFLSTRYER